MNGGFEFALFHDASVNFQHCEVLIIVGLFAVKSNDLGGNQAVIVTLHNTAAAFMYNPGAPQRPS
jgi:hypothetical protein